MCLGEFRVVDPDAAAIIEQGPEDTCAAVLQVNDLIPALLAFTDAGRVALLRWEFAGQNPGTLEKFLPEGMSGERVVQLLPLPQEAEGKSVGLLSSDGRFKRLPLAEFLELSGRATSILKLKEGVSLKRVVLCQNGDDLVVGSSAGRLLRLEVNEENLPVMGRNAQGPVLLRLLPGESVVGSAPVRAEDCVLLASRSGQLKRLTTNSLRRCQRGAIGQIAMQFSLRTDELIDLSEGHSPVLAALLSDGRSLRLDTAQLREEDESGSGEQLGIGSNGALVELIPLLS